jgi:hypothetical protein
MQLVTLFDHLTTSTAPVAKPARERRSARDGHLKYSRWPGRGFKQQLRVWLAGHGSINCGLYDPELLPIVRKRLLTECAKFASTPLGIWQALMLILDDFRERGIDVPDVLPRYVERGPSGFFGFVRKGGRIIETPTFDTPEAAHLAMEKRLAQEFPTRLRATCVTLADFLPLAPARAPEAEPGPKQAGDASGNDRPS